MASGINRREFLNLVTAPILTPSNARGLLSASPAAAERDWVTTGHAFPELASFDTTLRSFMQERAISGASLAVTRHRKLLVARGYTYSNDMEDAIVEPGSVFRIASISKPFTAVAILRLVQDGQLALTEKLVDLLELSPPRGRVPDPFLQDVTVLNLLQHVGGWDRQIAFDPMFRDFTISRALGLPLPISRTDIATYMTGQPLQHRPGTTYAYSNYGYSLLGRTVESVAGMPYQDYVRAKVFTPLSIATAALGRTTHRHAQTARHAAHRAGRGHRTHPRAQPGPAGARARDHIFENNDPEQFHNHPWPSASLLLRGGPVFEDTRHGTTVIENGSVMLRPAAHRHRIRLRHGPLLYAGSLARIPAMTLFATGRRIQQWDFEQPDGSIKPAKKTARTAQPLPRR